MKKARKHVCQFEHWYEEPAKSQPNLSRWKKLKKSFRKFTTVSSHYPKTKYLFRSSYAILAEELRHMESESWFSIHPYSLFNFSWQIIMCFVYVLNVVCDLLETTYILKYNTPWITTFTKIILFLSVITSIDLFINFFIGYIEMIKKDDYILGYSHYESSEATVILEQGKIARRYLKSFFLIDCITLVNMFVIIMRPYFGRKRMAYYLIAVRLVRHARFKTVFYNVKLLLDSMLHESDVVYKVIRITFLFYYMRFCLGCLLVLIPDMIMFFQEKEISCFVRSLEIRYKLIGRRLTMEALIQHANEIIGFTLLGAPLQHLYNVSLDFHLTYCLCLAGSWMFRAFFFCLVLKILRNNMQSQLEFSYFIKAVSNFEKKKGVDERTSRHIHSYLRTTLKTEFFNEQEILDTLERDMRYEIFTQSSMDLVRTCHLFRNLPSLFISKLATRLKLETYFSGISIVRLGELATCMYFIRSGTVAVFGEHGREICHLGDGDYFGEMGLLPAALTTRVASVVSVEYCELYRLDVRDFQEVIKPGSEFHQRILLRSIQRMADRRKSDSWARASVRPSGRSVSSSFLRNVVSSRVIF